MLYILISIIVILLIIVLFYFNKIKALKKQLLSKKDHPIDETSTLYFFEEAYTPMLLVDAKTLKFLDCNQSALKLYKFESKEILRSKTPIELSTPLQKDGYFSIEKILDYIKEAHDKGQVLFEWRLQSDEGESWDTEIFLQYFIMQDREVMLFSLLNISDSSKIKNFLRNLIHNNPIPMQLIDAAGYTFGFNMEFYNLFGNTPDLNSNIFHDDRLLKHDFKKFLDKAKNGEVVLFPPFPYNPHASNEMFPDKIRWIQIIAFPFIGLKNTVEHYIFMYNDITQKKESEEALRQSENLARAVIDNSSIGISVRSTTGQLLLYNQAWKDIWEISDERLAKDLKPKEALNFNERDSYFSEYQNLVKKVYTEGGECLLPEIQTTGRNSKSGLPRIISQHFKSISNENGEVERVVILSTDITKMKQSEQEKEKLQIQLNQAQKMESIGRLAGGVAHDFNNMLGVIIGYADMALISLDQNNPVFNYVNEINKAANKSANLTRQLLAFARKQAVHPVVLDLNSAVKGMKKMLARLIMEEIELEFVPYQEELKIKIDPSQVDQILANLCVNARDAIESKGLIRIETSYLEIDKTFCSSHPDFSEGSYAVLTVTDNGSGMDQETLEHIFEPFFTTKEAGKGTGLGLATVYGIVKQNLGNIEVNSKPGKGTTFLIYLPIYKEEAEEIAEEVINDPLKGKETLLLVEDEAMLLDMTKSMLEYYGYNVLYSSSPEEALNIAQNAPQKIDLLITDIIMPGMNGKVLKDKIFEIRNDIDYLFISGYTDNILEPHGITNQSRNFLQKPFNIDDLARKVRDILDNKSIAQTAD